MKRKAKNPAKFDRCVKAVKRKGGAVSPYAVCTAAGTRGNPAYFEIRQKQGDNWLFIGHVLAKNAQAAVRQARLSPDIRKGSVLRAQRVKHNPPEQAAAAYEGFHGRESEETVVVEKQIHYHKHLASAGKLEKLTVVSRQGYKVDLSGFKGAFLSFNEKRTQLYIEGGDQAVELRQFGINPKTAHEQETLGDVLAVEYFTTKDHLGSQGGTAIYRHRFAKPYPELMYDVINQALSFWGGKYTIPDEGIDH